MSTGRPCTVEEVFNDFKGRRAGMLKALTSDVEEFFLQCDPKRENLCLHGHPNADWEVSPPPREFSLKIPEPAPGINFVRVGRPREDWLSYVAIHSDAWLLSVAYFYGAVLHKYERKRLFDMMNALPTLFDIITGKKLVKKEASIISTGGNQGKLTGRKMQRAVEVQPKLSTPPAPKEETDALEEHDEEDPDTYCETCGEIYTTAIDSFWIGCDSCDKWFHGKCVKITQAKAEHIESYKCPLCSNKRARNGTLSSCSFRARRLLK